jgi:prepilin-type N-terminal cleavage/methylation domain-containing protein/prepilin-type processing-associated H-X9-DG protein
MPRHRVRHAGFTLIELLVVIAIIGVMILLLLPAVMKVREASNLTRCRNNLKQIGIAMQEYHNVQGSYPVGYYDPTPWPQTDNGPGWGWNAYLLPYLEQENLFNQIHFDLDVGDAKNDPIRNVFLKNLMCPSDPVPTSFTVNDGGSNSWTMAQSSYVACNGNDGVDDFTTPPHTGPFIRSTEGFGFKDITDGLSNTFLVGERTGLLSYSTWVGGPTGAQNPFLQDPGNFGAEVTLLLFHAGPTGPNSAGVFDADSTSSSHRNGLNILFGDGSVRFINNAIDINTWMALATRAGGEPVSTGDF